MEFIKLIFSRIKIYFLQLQYIKIETNVKKLKGKIKDSSIFLRNKKINYVYFICDHGKYMKYTNV